MKNPSECTVLVVEDETSLLRAIAGKLSREGFHTLEAKNGEEGLRIALEKHPDLILLDIVMPEMDGMTMMRNLRDKDEWGKKVPIIFLTNLSADAQVEQSVKNGGYEYLMKTDWTLEQVVAKVKATLSL